VRICGYFSKPKRYRRASPFGKTTILHMNF